MLQVEYFHLAAVKSKANHMIPEYHLNNNIIE